MRWKLAGWGGGLGVQGELSNKRGHREGWRSWENRRRRVQRQTKPGLQDGFYEPMCEWESSRRCEKEKAARQQGANETGVRLAGKTRGSVRMCSDTTALLHGNTSMLTFNRYSGLIRSRSRDCNNRKSITSASIVWFPVWYNGHLLLRSFKRRYTQFVSGFNIANSS